MNYLAVYQYSNHECSPHLRSSGSTSESHASVVDALSHTCVPYVTVYIRCPRLPQSSLHSKQSETQSGSTSSSIKPSHPRINFHSINPTNHPPQPLSHHSPQCLPDSQPSATIPPPLLATSKDQAHPPQTNHNATVTHPQNPKRASSYQDTNILPKGVSSTPPTLSLFASILTTHYRTQAKEAIESESQRRFRETVKDVIPRSKLTQEGFLERKPRHKRWRF